MEIELNDEIKSLRNQNKVLQGKIRGYQTLGQLFKELKEKNRILEMNQNKSMVSVATEMEPGPTDKCGINSIESHDPENELCEASVSAPNKGKDPLISHLSFTSSTGLVDNNFLSNTNLDNPEEVNIVLKKKLEDALQIVEEYEQKRSNDKVLVKILNVEIKKTKDELQSTQMKFKQAKNDNEMLLMKVGLLEQKLYNPQNTGATMTVTGEIEGAEDWVHLHKGNLNENIDEPKKDFQIQELTEKCKELEAKASRWEREHFNLQREYTKHSSELRCLLESKSKELCKVTEAMNVEKNLLEMKFKQLESMYESEKKSNSDAQQKIDLTTKKYRTLENKFMALEQKNQIPVYEHPELKENLVSQMDSILTSNKQVLMLKQQLEIFKDDFEKERKERIVAERGQKAIEEKLVNISKQLEKKEFELAKCEKSLAEEGAKTEKLIQKIKTLEANYKTVNHHNYLLLELQSKLSESQPNKVKEVFPSPHTAPKEIRLLVSKSWKCRCCTFINDPQVENCKMCKAPRPVIQGASCSSHWKCRSCTFSNNMFVDTCSMCNVPRNKLASKEVETLKWQRNDPESETIENNIDEDLDIDGPFPEYLLK